MHILLTDILTCPRCGPSFGLILLADRVVDRRVLFGTLGCANCREKYAVTDGEVRFEGGRGAAGASGIEGGAAAKEGDGAAALRLAALLGVTEGPGYLVLAGGAAEHAGAVAGIVPGVEVIAVTNAARGVTARASAPDEDGPHYADGSGVSRLSAGSRLPLGTARAAGVALTGDEAELWLEECARVMAPLGRLVIEPAPAGAEQRLQASGLRVLVREGDTIVAARV
jgi:uncharacterized protein YbaR (Trm112 family)